MLIYSLPPCWNIIGKQGAFEKNNYLVNKSSNKTHFVLKEAVCQNSHSQDDAIFEVYRKANRWN